MQGVSWSVAVEACAKALFGRTLRLQLAEWILQRQGEAFFLQEAQQAMSAAYGEAGSGVRKELELLVHYGLLQRVPSERRTYFTVVDGHPLWSGYAATLEGLRVMTPVDPPIRV